MADYKGIKGFTIQNLSADPPAPILGQVWYNSTTNVLKGRNAGAGAWASGTSMNVVRSVDASVGTTTAAIISGGASNTFVGSTETYDGTSWTEVADRSIINLSRGAGTQTAELAFFGYGGSPVVSRANTEIWDGTSWTELVEGNTARQNIGGCGAVTTAALVYGGEGGTPWLLNKDKTELWDGTSWTEVNNLTTGRSLNSGAGTQTSALTAGGNAPPQTANVETWDGTCWTEVNNLNLSAYGRAGTGTSSSNGTVSGGRITGMPGSALTESYDGTSWTEVADLGSPRYNMAVAGTATSGLVMGGSPTGSAGSTTVEVWSGAPETTVTFTSS